jgi:hypothetical protein
MHFAKTDLVLPLNWAENAFLEVLLSRFTLNRKTKSDGVELIYTRFRERVAKFL